MMSIEKKIAASKCSYYLRNRREIDRQLKEVNQQITEARKNERSALRNWDKGSYIKWLAVVDELVVRRYGLQEYVNAATEEVE